MKSTLCEARKLYKHKYSMTENEKTKGKNDKTFAIVFGNVQNAKTRIQKSTFFGVQGIISAEKN